MKIFNQEIFPRTNFWLLKDSLSRSFETVILFLRGKAEKNFSFTDRYAVRRIIEYYSGDEAHRVNKETGNLGYGFIHYALIRNLQPKRVLCVGSRKGFIPALCALACKDNQKGRVDFIDAGYNEDHPKSWSGVGFWKRTDPRRHFSLLGLSKWIKTYVITSEEFARKFPKRKYGYIYIDGDHSYEGVKLDYQLFWPKLEKGGFMIFHDVTVKQWKKLSGFGVWKLWKEIKSGHKIIFPFPRESGLGIIQKV